MSMETLRSFARAEARKRTLKAELAEVETELKGLEDQVLAWFEAEGIDKIRCDGRTFYLRCERWPAKVDKSADPRDLCLLLHSTGFDEYARESINWQGLRSLFTERANEGEEPVPDVLRAGFTVEERYRVGSRKS